MSDARKEVKMKLVKKEVDVSGVDLDAIKKKSEDLYAKWQDMLDSEITKAMAKVGVTDPIAESKMENPRISAHSTGALGGTTTIKFCGTPIFEYHISTSIDIANPVMTLKYKTIVDEKA